MRSIRPLQRHALPFVLAATLSSATCFVFRTVSVESVPPARSAGPPTRVQSPLKAHLDDGSVVLFRGGATLEGDTVRGHGELYDLKLRSRGAVTAVPLSRVLAMENYREGVDAAGTVAVSMLATVGFIGGSVALYCAADPKCFGSCPTAYSDSAGTLVLEAEGFSYSIAPLFEAGDVDRLRARAGADGTLRLEVRNEALETHYINQIELLEARHAADETVLPDPRHDLVAVSGLVPPGSATDRAGRDVLPALAAHDGVVFGTDSTTLARADSADPDDWIDLEWASRPAGDSAALVFRMRNSLLNTVLLYDLMLGDHGARALDYLGMDLQRPADALALGRWYAGRMGMRVSVWEAGAWRAVGRVPDTGPIAWKDAALLIPLPPAGPLRVRLSFPADDWRIDRVALASGARRVRPRTVPLARVLDADGHADSAALANLAAADARYLETSAGQRFEAVFDVGPEPADSARTFLLAWRGFYDEWIRRTWIERGAERRAFTPGDGALAAALRRWSATQDSTERVFYRTRVPVR